MCAAPSRVCRDDLSIETRLSSSVGVLYVSALEMGSDQDKYIDGAIRWAAERLHSTDYAYRCYLFVEDAYELGNNIVLDGREATAKEAADAYHAERHTDTPARGAYVFYDCFVTIQGEYRNWGHIGISLGEGLVVHAWDEVRVDGYLEIEQLESPPDWVKPKYIGWAPASVILRGMTAAERRTPDRPGEERSRIT